MKTDARITIVRRNFQPRATKERRRGGSPLSSPRRRSFRVSVALTPSRKVVAIDVLKEKRLRGGAALNGMSFSAEDENWIAYYHLEKNFFRVSEWDGPTSMPKKRPCYPNSNH
jgi:hypothetical protein